VSRGGSKGAGAALLPWLALVLALLALARPQQGLRLSETESRGVDIVLAIDISPSMSAQDFLPRNRLNVAKETAREFIRHRPHDRIGVVGFAATAFTQCPHIATMSNKAVCLRMQFHK
jgi:Ca-activated chloride channel family protein